jgi:ribonuclease I
MVRGIYLVVLLAIIAVAFGSSCDDITSKSDCFGASCSWCTSGAVGDSCVSAEDAAALPAAVFSCSSETELTHHHHSGSGGSPGKNEGADTMYVLAYSWTPGFCNTQSNDPGCSNPESYWKNHFTLHGLWPQYTTDGYPRLYQ